MAVDFGSGFDAAEVDAVGKPKLPRPQSSSSTTGVDMALEEGTGAGETKSSNDPHSSFVSGGFAFAGYVAAGLVDPSMSSPAHASDFPVGWELDNVELYVWIFCCSACFALSAIVIFVAFVNTPPAAVENRSPNASSLVLLGFNCNVDEVDGVKGREEGAEDVADRMENASYVRRGTEFEDDD